MQQFWFSKFLFKKMDERLFVYLLKAATVKDFAVIFFLKLFS